jgi:hypothetical protein
MLYFANSSKNVKYRTPVSAPILTQLEFDRKSVEILKEQMLEFKILRHLCRVYEGDRGLH